MPRRPLFWFGVARKANGELEIKRIAPSADEQDGIVVVQARDEEHAGRLAMRLYQLADSRRRREQYAKNGQCPYCGRPQDRKPGGRCSVCVEQHNRDSARARRRERGEKIAKPDPKVARRERRAEEDAAIRLTALEEVWAVWKRRGAAGLTQWLRKEIAKLSEGEAA